MYVKIYFPQETIISAMVVPDFSYNQAYYNDLSPADNSIRFSILFNTNIANLIKTNINRNIKVEVKNTDDTNYFTGFLKKNVAFSKDSRNNNISIEVVSPTAILDEQFSSEAWYTNISLSNAVENMLEACGVDNYNLSNLPSITLPVFHIEEKSNVKTELTELLFEYGFCFDFDNDGVFICNPLFNEPPEVITNTFTDGKTGNLIGTVTQTLQERRFDGVSAEYNKLIQKSNQLIFSDTSTHEVKAGSKLYDNEEGTYTEYDSTVGEPFYIQSINNWIVGNDVYKINKLLPESARWKGVFTNYGKRGLLSVTNKLNQDLELTNVEIYGSGFFISEGEKAVNQDGKNLEEFFLDYIFDSENASRFAENVRKYYKFSNIKLLLHSYDDYAYGSFCVVSVAGMGTVKGRIVQKKKTLQSNLIEYTIEAIEEFTPAEIKIETSANSNQASAITNQVVEQITPAIEQIVEPVVESSIATVYPRYRGSFVEFPLHDALNKGDWVFLNTPIYEEEEIVSDIGLYKNSYDATTGLYSWELITYENDGSNDTYFNAAASDLLSYYTSDNTTVGAYARAYINNLFVNKLVIADGGSIQSSNYSEENGTGFLIDSNGDIKANSGFFNGFIGNLKKIGDLTFYSSFNLYRYLLNFDTDKDIYKTYENKCKRLDFYVKSKVEGMYSALSYVGYIITKGYTSLDGYYYIQMGNGLFNDYVWSVNKSGGQQSSTYKRYFIIEFRANEEMELFMVENPINL